MTEEPRLEKAFHKLMEELDKGIQPALAVTRRDQLVPDIVNQLIESLHLNRPTSVEIEEEQKIARTKLEQALRYWLEVNDYGHGC